MVNSNWTGLTIPLALFGVLFVVLPYTSESCYILRLDISSTSCPRAFPACREGSLDTIQVTHANVTVTSDNDDGTTSTQTVNATEAANSIVHCNTFTCESLAYILLANYSTQYCLGTSNRFFASLGYIYVYAVVSVEYTGASGMNASDTIFFGDFSGVSGYLDNRGSCAIFHLANETDHLTPPSVESVLEPFTCLQNITSTESPTIEITSGTHPSPTSPTDVATLSLTSTGVPLETTDASFTSTGVPLETTDASFTSTDAPLETTDASFTSTDAPLETTDASLNSTGAPLETTDASLTSIAAPLETTDASLTSTGAPLKPTNAPLTSTGAPLETMDASPTSRGAPLETMDAFLTSTGVPLETTDTSLASTDAPLETTDASLPSTDVPLETIDASPTSTGAPLETTDTSLTSIGAPFETTDSSLRPTSSSSSELTQSSIATSKMTSSKMTSSMTFMSSVSASNALEDLHLLLNPEVLEQMVFEIGMSLSRGQSIIVKNTYIYRAAVEDLCATRWNITLNGNQFSLPQKYFCERSDQSKDGGDRQPDIIVAITWSTRLAELYNNNTFNATYNKKDANLRVASDVITASAFIGDELDGWSSVSVPFSFTLKHSAAIGQRFDSPTCSFWNQDRRNWNSTGCQEIATDDLNMTSCYCDHMTSFAILVSLVPSELDGDIISDILTWIGLGLSITSLVISLVTFFILRHSLTADRVIIHVNLMVAILFADITFFSGINPIGIKTACKAYSYVLHYFYLAVVFWMVVEGVHLYRQIIRVFESGNPRIWVYGIIGWGFPAVIILITGVAKHESYGYEQSCWLNPTDGTIWAFSGPAIGIVLINVVILLLVVKTVVSASRGQLDNDKINQIKAGLRSTVLLLPLLGIPWLLTPLVASFGHVTALEYIYIILNTLQGFFVALFYCFLNSEVRNAIGESIRKVRDSHALDSHQSTTDTILATSEGSTVKLGLRPIRIAPTPVCPTQNQAGASKSSSNNDEYSATTPL